MVETRGWTKRLGWRKPTRGRAAVRLAGGLVLAAFLLPLAALPARAQFISFIRDTEIEKLLDDYSRPVFRAASYGAGRLNIRIVRHDSFNAFVLDGNSVFIHTGALFQSETPNQVIGVLAHETGHLVGRHIPELRDRIARDQTKSILIKLLGIGLMVAGGGGGTTGAGTGILAGGDELIMRSLLKDRRAHELEADRIGLRLLTATRQSGLGMLETFERFAQQEYISASGATQDVFARTHPVAAQRLAQLRDAVERSPYYKQKDSPALQLRHDMMRAKLAGYLERPAIVMNRYPASNTTLPARYARTIAIFFQSGLERALPEVDKLIKEKPDNPYFHELKADFLMRTGKSREAIPSLRQALKLAGDAPLIAVRLAQALISANDARGVDEAIALARKSLIADPNPQAYRLLASGFGSKGLTPQADLATAEALFLEGNIKQAQIFAKRAQRGLKNGSPEAIRAGDIVNYRTPT